MDSEIKKRILIPNEPSTPDHRMHFIHIPLESATQFSNGWATDVPMPQGELPADGEHVTAVYCTETQVPAVVLATYCGQNFDRCQVILSPFSNLGDLSDCER